MAAAAVADLVASRLGPGQYGRIARRTGLDRLYISRVCRGLREPSFDVAKMIADGAGITLDELWAHTAKYRNVRVARSKVA